jgi:hypothetical protein
MPDDTRSDVSARRKRPAAATQFIFPAACGGDFTRIGTEIPTEILVEPTYPTGEVAEWFDDAWWTEAIQRWGNTKLNVHILPSRLALCDPVVLHMMAMLKRIVPQWRLVGFGYAGEIDGETGPDALARSNYDEVRMTEGFRRTRKTDSNSRHILRIEDLFARVRRGQQARNATRPTLVRATVMPVVPGEVSAPSEKSPIHSQTI